MYFRAVIIQIGIFRLFMLLKSWYYTYMKTNIYA